MDFLKRYITQKAVTWLAKKMIIALAPYAVPLIGIFLAWYVIYSTFFYLPHMFSEKTGVLAFFSTGDEEWDTTKDQSLKEKYVELTEDIGSKERQPHTPSKYQQALPYQVPWSLLAAVDRVLGDPIVGDKVNRKPDPVGHYEAIKPTFTWRDSTVTVTTCDEDGECSTETYTVQLLQTADTYQSMNRLVYRWETTGDENSSTTREVLDHVETTYYDDDHNRLYILLRKYGLPIKERKLIEELSLAYSDDPRQQERDWLLKRYGGQKGPPIEVTGDWILPLAGTIGGNIVMTSPFGYRDDPFNGTSSYHDGVDLVGRMGDPVYAPHSGTVIYAKNMRGYGNCIMIDHGGIITLYGHLSTISVEEGQQVAIGEHIGNVGSTGRSTGPHLHWGAYSQSFGKSNAMNALSLVAKK